MHISFLNDYLYKISFLTPRFIIHTALQRKRWIILLFALLMNFSFAGEDSTSKKNKNNQIDEWFAVDKAQHFMYSAFVSFGTQYVLVNKIQMNESEALPVSSLLSFSAGLLKEIHDNKSKNGFFSKKDMVANSFGIVFAGLIISS